MVSGLFTLKGPYGQAHTGPPYLGSIWQSHIGRHMADVNNDCALKLPRPAKAWRVSQLCFKVLAPRSRARWAWRRLGVSLLISRPPSPQVPHHSLQPIPPLSTISQYSQARAEWLEQNGNFIAGEVHGRRGLRFALSTNSGPLYGYPPDDFVIMLGLWLASLITRSELKKCLAL